MKSIRYFLPLFILPMLLSLATPVKSTVNVLTEEVPAQWIEDMIENLRCLPEDRMRPKQKHKIRRIISEMEFEVSRWENGTIPKKEYEQLKQKWGKDLIPTLEAFKAYTTPGSQGSDRYPLLPEHKECLDLAITYWRFSIYGQV